MLAVVAVCLRLKDACVLLHGGEPRPGGHFSLPCVPGNHDGAYAPDGSAEKSVSWAFTAFAAPILDFFKSHQIG